MKIPRAAWYAWLTAGTLDLAYAMVVTALRGKSALLVPQGIASGLLGPGSFDLGATSIALGIALHYAMMGGIVIVYFLAAQSLPMLVRRWYLFGPLYGLAVFLVMNFAVVPLSAIGHVIHRKPVMLAGELFSHLVFVGLVIAGFRARPR